MPRPSPERDLLLSALDEAFERKAWHGPNLLGTLRRVNAAQAAWRPGPGRHNIWEIALHTAYWKYAVRRRLTGEKRGSFALSGSNWFRRDRGDAKAWKSDLKLLAEEHRRLRQAVAGLDATDLPKKTGASRYSNAFVIRGIAAHDLYHAGQIQLLKRLQAAAAA
ncbi:MAG TPA: DinB family protein [Vicinamibacteria bacterium]|nr:DinB family protein [Vicinamibacteria bacterium]